MERRVRGFTLIEVLVALAIVAIALMAGLQATTALTLRALLRLNFGDEPPFTLHGTESAGELADTLRQLS